jgi:hypothetical protein
MDAMTFLMSKLRCRDAKKKIYLMSKNFFGVEGIIVNTVIAEYSTEEKAIKAMEECSWTWWKHNGFMIFQFPADEDIEV